MVALLADDAGCPGGGAMASAPVLAGWEEGKAVGSATGRKDGAEGARPVTGGFRGMAGKHGQGRLAPCRVELGKSGIRMGGTITRHRSRHRGTIGGTIAGAARMRMVRQLPAPRFAVIPPAFASTACFCRSCRWPRGPYWMMPPPRHTSPSYSTADWPGVTAHCASSKRS